MDVRDKYRRLGWRSEHWEYVRLYRSLRGNAATTWRRQMLSTGKIIIGDSFTFPLEGEAPRFLDEYLTDVEADAAAAHLALRTEPEAVAACKTIGVEVARTATRNQDHHQSSKALVAEVSGHVQAFAQANGLSVETDPQRRGVWANAHGFHVTARNLDGALPGLLNPLAVWEIKEYWGITAGGSKMSDAVYECQLVGRELREFSDRTGTKIVHLVFLDGRDQWNKRRSDLVRFIDLFHQGLIDHLIIGHQTTTEWPELLQRFRPR